MRPLPALCRLVLAFALLFAPAAALAAPPKGGPAPAPAAGVPEVLRPWVPWVLGGDDEATRCPTYYGQADSRNCTWPSRLLLDVGPKGGRFRQGWRLDARAWVPLPGDEKRWPQNVLVDGRRAVVTLQGGAPSVELAAGDHQVTGEFLWDSAPESLKVPPATGLLSLTLAGAPVREPHLEGGVVYLQRGDTREEGERLELLVHRHVIDGVPALLATRIALNVSGKGREVLLGRALPEGFLPLSLESPLPARVEADGRLRVQLRPGDYVLTLTARSAGPVASLPRPDPQGPWREGEEVWVFTAHPELRQVTVEGVPAVDPQQTSLPDEWKRLPAYRVRVGEAMRLVERRRGDADPPPDQLALRRKLWLDFDGGGYTFTDEVSGTLERDRRLEMTPPVTLGRVSVQESGGGRGKDRFITRLDDPSTTGVELRRGPLKLSADGRIAGHASRVPAVGWAQDMSQVAGTLYLPPGWRLLHASGVDDASPTWVRHWTLLELFLVVITSLAVGRLYGPRWGVAAAALLGLTFPEAGAPRWAWLALLAAEALVRVLPPGHVQRGLRYLRGAAALGLVLVALPFLIEHVRHGMFPVLGEHGRFDSGSVGDAPTRSPDGDVTVAAQVEKSAETDVDQAGEPWARDDKEGGTGTRAKGEEGTMAPAAPAPTSTSLLGGKKFGLKGDRQGYLSDERVKERQYNMSAYDPNAMVQTGPGLPTWAWHSVNLRWSGPVERQQQIRLYLTSPLENRLLAFVRAGLLVLLVLKLLPPFGGRSPRRLWPFARGGAAAAGLVLACVAAPRAASAQALPDKELLDELKKRLSEPASCLPNCASSPRLLIEASRGALRLRLQVDAAAPTAVPLPASSQWTPTLVTVDGKDAAALVRREGKLWLGVAPGSHQIVLEGSVGERDSVPLSLPLKPRRVESRLEGWALGGVHEDGLADDDLQLSRLRSAGEPGGGGQPPALGAGALPPFVRVERTLQIGLNWQVETKVVRVSPPGDAIVIEVPLLPAESVTSDAYVAGGKVLVNLGPQVRETAWRSVLEQRSPLRLEAPASPSIIEVWRVDVSPIWHASFKGLPPVRGEGGALSELRPWPGESAVLEISRPEGVPGQTLTVDKSTLDVRPGARQTESELALTVRSSRGTEHVLTLPEGARLNAVTINGAALPARSEGRKVTLPVVPGSQRVVVSFREPAGADLVYRTPQVDLGVPSVNAEVQVRGLEGRWVLFVGGPPVGPVVLFWSMLVVLAVVAFALGRVPWAPLRAHHWALLGIGLSQTSVYTAAFVVGWLLLLGWRRKDPELPAGAFNARQALLVAWTLVALGLLAYAIRQGLLGAPEMQIEGNGSHYGFLRWYSDRAGPVPPGAWVVSVPMLVYRVAMLAWALWVALALLRWLRWGWEAFTTEGLWRKVPRKAPPPPPPAPMGPTGPTEPTGPMGPPPGAPPGPVGFSPGAPTGPMGPPPGPMGFSPGAPPGPVGFAPGASPGPVGLAAPPSSPGSTGLAAPPSSSPRRPMGITAPPPSSPPGPAGFMTPPPSSSPASVGAPTSSRDTPLRSTAAWPAGGPPSEPRSALKTTMPSASTNHEWALRPSEPPEPVSRPIGPPSSSSGLRRPSVVGYGPPSEPTLSRALDERTVVSPREIAPPPAVPALPPPEAPSADASLQISQSMEGRVATGPVTLPGFLSAPEVLPDETPVGGGGKGSRSS
ncbi:MAG TPA: hypothetical protein VFS43_33145 [Polyangiaceae bacterium]|nr:hypothetical protein [Polyangiaceae bacterium]